MNVYEELTWRGLIQDSTEGAEEYLRENSVTLYCGFDPTADSLHAGSLMPLMGLARFQRAGHTPIGLVGGGTGLVGDPSGKSQERQLQSYEAIEANIAGIRKQMERFLDFDAQPNGAMLIDNGDWLRDIRLMEFLRDVAKNFTVNAMMAKESVKRRIESEDGISFTEFTYMLLQAYDFVKLHDLHGCTLQVGGSDQWGNITAGMDLLRRMRGGKAYGLTFPLVTTASGTKFGKTEAGTIWLSAERTSPFRFYQFWLNTDDKDVVHYLKSFTWLSRPEIEELERTVRESPERREAQRVLAERVTEMIHGRDALERAAHASRVLFSEELAELPPDDILAVFDDVPSVTIQPSELGGEGLPVADLLARTDLAKSKGEARRLIKGNGVSLNNRRLGDPEGRVTAGDAIGGRVLLLRKGKKSWFVVRVG